MNWGKNPKTLSCSLRIVAEKVTICHDNLVRYRRRPCRISTRVDRVQRKKLWFAFRNGGYHWLWLFQDGN